MNYAITSKSAHDELIDLVLLDLVTSYSTPHNLQDNCVVNIGEDKIELSVHIEPAVIDTETIQTEEGSIEVEITNKQDVIDSLTLPLADWQELNIHECSHDEGTSSPCGQWETVYQNGEIPEVDEL